MRRSRMSHIRRSTETVSHRVGIAATALALAALVGCSGSDGSDSGSDSRVTSSGGEMAALESRAASDSTSPPARGTANRASVQTQAVIRTGRVAITGEDLDATRADLDDLLLEMGGSIDREGTSHDDEGNIERSTLVLRIPVDNFEATMEALERLGTVETSQSNSKDVTTELIDVNERVQTIQNSLDRLQSFQRQSKDIDDLIRFEDQITARESELRSLQAQQSYLVDQTSMSTITLYLSTPDKYVAPPDALEDAGFLAGLTGGWNALKDFVVVALTLAGAVLPFVITIALGGVPVWLLVRALVRRRNTGAVAEPSALAPPTP